MQWHGNLKSLYLLSTEPDPDHPGCIRWRGKPVTSKYRKLKINGELWDAHRFSYAVNKSDPGKKAVHHLCGNTQCVNVEHLVLLSTADHARLHEATQGDWQNKVGPNSRKLVCPKCGGPYDLKELDKQGKFLRRICSTCSRKGPTKQRIPILTEVTSLLLAESV